MDSWMTLNFCSWECTIRLTGHDEEKDGKLWAKADMNVGDGVVCLMIYTKDQGNEDQPKAWIDIPVELVGPLAAMVEAAKGKEDLGER